MANPMHVCPISPPQPMWTAEIVNGDEIHVTGPCLAIGLAYDETRGLWDEILILGSEMGGNPAEEWATTPEGALWLAENMAIDVAKLRGLSAPLTVVAWSPP